MLTVTSCTISAQTTSPMQFRIHVCLDEPQSENNSDRELYNAVAQINLIFNDKPSRNPLSLLATELGHR